MNIPDRIIKLINDNNDNDFESFLNNNEMILYYNIETELLLKCINEDKIKFFEMLIHNKLSSIYYFNFNNILTEIIKKNDTSNNPLNDTSNNPLNDTSNNPLNNQNDYYKIIFSIKNISSYVSFESIVDLSVTNNNYSIIKYIIDNSLYNFNYNSYIYYTKLLTKIKDIDIVNIFIDKILRNKYKYANTNQKKEKDVINLNCYYECDDEIFKSLFDIILENDKNYLDIIKYTKHNDKNIKNNFNLFKFNYIYDKLDNENNIKIFKEISIFNCFYTNNIELIEQLVDKFNYSSDDILTIIKKYKKIKNNRNLVDIIINKFAEKPSYYLYKKYKNYMTTNNINILIYSSIENNNILILNDLEITGGDNKKINIKKIENYILNNHIHKVYINENTMNILFNKFNLLKNINFCINYAKILLENNEKKGMTNLIDTIYTDDLYDEKYRKNFEKKIKNFIISNIIIKRLSEGDIYDWYFIEWIDSKLSNIHILKDSINCIKNNTSINEPNIHFLYWHLKIENELLEKSYMDELLIKLHSNFNTLTKFMIDNIEYDYILKDKIKDILSRDKDNIIKQNLITSIFTKNTLDDIIKLENIDNDMIKIFENIYNDKHTLFNIFKYSLNILSYSVTNYLINKLKKVKISSIKMIVKCIIANKNYYFMNKITESMLFKDKNAFLQKLLIESVKHNNIIIVEWAYNKLKYIKCENFNDEFQKKIKKLFEKNVQPGLFDSNIIEVYDFYINLIKYLSDENKQLLYKNILDIFCDNKYILDNFLIEHISFKSFTDKEKYEFLKNIIGFVDKYKIERCIENLNITKDDYIVISKLSKEDIDSNGEHQFEDIIDKSFEFNLLYNHSFQFIKYLNDMGLQLYLDIDIIQELFTTSHFNRSNDEDINNIIILELMIQLSDINLFKIDVDTINIFLEYYESVKYKITVDDIKYLIEKYDIKLEYKLYYSSAGSKTKLLFDYLYKLENINLRQYDEKIFFQSCTGNDVKFAKYLLELDPTINVSINNDLIFAECCNKGSLDVIEWLYDIIPNMNHKAKYEYSICGACYYGRIGTVKWLMNNINDLDIKVDNDYCMVSAIDNECYHIINYINDIEPERYNIVWDDNNNIINFSINKNLIIDNTKLISTVIECPICYDNNSSMVTCCNHQFCYDCFNQYYKKNSNISCPYCRKENIELFNIEDIDLVETDVVETDVVETDVVETDLVEIEVIKKE